MHAWHIKSQQGTKKSCAPEFLILSATFRSNRPEVFCKKGVLRNLTKFPGKHLCQSLFFNKVAGLNPATLLKRDSGTGVFLGISRNFLEHLFLQKTSGGCFFTSIWTGGVYKYEHSGTNFKTCLKENYPIALESCNLH